jgi:hypothetical protein
VTIVPFPFQGWITREPVVKRLVDTKAIQDEARNQARDRYGKDPSHLLGLCSIHAYCISDFDRSQFPQRSECAVSPVVRNFPDQQCGKNTTCSLFAGSGKFPARMSGNTQGARRGVFFGAHNQAMHWQRIPRGMCKYIKLTFKNDELDNKDMNLGTK